MKLEIYGQEPEEEKTLTLRLNKYGEEILLEAVDNHGQCVTKLLAITPEGLIYKYLVDKNTLGLGGFSDGVIYSFTNEFRKQNT